jgi:hypothetical protein
MLMARIYLAEEILAVIGQARNKLDSATKLISSTEANVKSAIRAHQVPTEVNGVGAEGYEAAGVLIAEAIAVLTTLGASADIGLVFPTIVAIGSPVEFSRVHVDTWEDSAVVKGTIEAYNKHNGGQPDEPFGTPGGSTVLIANDVLKIINCPINIGTPHANFPANLAGMMISVKAVATRDPAGDPPVRDCINFDENFSWYNGETLTQPADADAGGESESFEARVVER